MEFLNVPDLFGIVEKDFYRSKLLSSSSHYNFIKTLQLKTVIVLSNEVPTKSLSTFLEEQKIKIFSLGSNIPKNTWRPISEEAIKEGLQICLERSNLPCLVMCATGYQDTGTFVGCFRKLQGWNFNGIFFEYQSFAGTKSRYVNEQFIELFDLDLITVPKDPPFLLISQPNRIESVKTNNDIPLDT